jgi:GMP synthase-like glutamine amidotransferase
VEQVIGVFQHGREEAAGALLDLLDASGQAYRVFPLHETGDVPDETFSHLLVLGGTMSVNDEPEFPFLSDEKACIRKMVGQKRPVLGVCLGAQMIASAFGARVYPSHKETGWSDVTWNGAVPGIPLSGRLRVFQWHGETFDLPPGASCPCSGDAVRNQALWYRSALGVQFHLEVTREILAVWTAGLDPAARAAIIGEAARALPGSREICGTITRAFLAGAYVHGA